MPRTLLQRIGATNATSDLSSTASNSAQTSIPTRPMSHNLFNRGEVYKEDTSTSTTSTSTSTLTTPTKSISTSFFSFKPTKPLSPPSPTPPIPCSVTISVAAAEQDESDPPSHPKLNPSTDPHPSLDLYPSSSASADTHANANRSNQPTPTRNTDPRTDLSIENIPTIHLPGLAITSAPSASISAPSASASASASASISAPSASASASATLNIDVQDPNMRRSTSRSRLNLPTDLGAQILSLSPSPRLPPLSPRNPSLSPRSPRNSFSTATSGSIATSTTTAISTLTATSGTASTSSFESAATPTLAKVKFAKPVMRGQYLSMRVSGGSIEEPETTIRRNMIQKANQGLNIQDSGAVATADHTAKGMPSQLSLQKSPSATSVFMGNASAEQSVEDRVWMDVNQTPQQPQRQPAREDGLYEIDHQWATKMDPVTLIFEDANDEAQFQKAICTKSARELFSLIYLMAVCAIVLSAQQYLAGAVLWCILLAVKSVTLVFMPSFFRSKMETQESMYYSIWSVFIYLTLVYTSYRSLERNPGHPFIFYGILLIYVVAIKSTLLENLKRVGLVLALVLISDAVSNPVVTIFQNFLAMLVFSVILLCISRSVEINERRSFLYTIVDALHKRQQLEEHNRMLSLLFSIYPRPVANQMLFSSSDQSPHFFSSMGTTMFIDIVNFKRFRSELRAKQLFNLLAKIHSEIDEIIERFSVDRIRTMGDRYMAVCGFVGDSNLAAQSVCGAALDVMKRFQEIHYELRTSPVRLSQTKLRSNLLNA